MEALVTGEEAKLRALVALCSSGPPMSHVNSIDIAQESFVSIMADAFSIKPTM